MFGYIRPESENLLVKEFNMFKAVYCGICMQLKNEYGNIPRATLSYDMTFLALLALSFSENDVELELGTCVLNPVRKKPIAKNNDIFSMCAALSVIFAYNKMLDDIRDSKKNIARAGKMLIKRAYKKGARKYPDLARIVEEGLSKLSEIEKKKLEKDTYERAAESFGKIIGDIYKYIFSNIFTEGEEKFTEAMYLLGRDTGIWIYLIDAVDDYDKDKEKGEWNPLSCWEKEEALLMTEIKLKECEASCDRTAALMPYKRNAGIISNVFTRGMPSVRNKIYNGIKITKL